MNKILRTLVCTLILATGMLLAADRSMTLVIPAPPASGVGLAAQVTVVPQISLVGTNRASGLTTNYLMQVRVTYQPVTKAGAGTVNLTPITVTYLEGRNLEPETVTWLKNLWKAKSPTWEADMGFPR